MDQFETEISVELKEGLNLQDLQDPNRGAVFEIDPNCIQPETETSNKLFPGEEVFKNILTMDDETAEICDREGLEKFEVLQRQMEDVTEDKDGGVFKKLVKPGAGPVAPQGALVRVHYNAYQELEAEPFDSTRLRHQMEKFRLGIDGSIRGLHVAVATMKKGERSHFIFKPDYFYGKHGCPPRIPPDCTVLFDLELVSFVEREGVDDYYMLTDEERKQVTLAFVCKVSKAEREEGNQLYNSGMYDRALGKYRRALKILEDYHLKNEEEQKEHEKLLTRVYLNMALCYTKQRQNGLTITYCNKVLKIDDKNVKALYHKAQALHHMSEFDQAKSFYLKAQRLDGTNKSISNALRKLEQDVKTFALQSADYKKMCQRMVSGSAPESSNTGASPATQDEKEEESEQCSDAFRATVEKKLEEFRSNSDIIQLPFPERSLTVPEIACIVEVAETLGMSVQRRGAGNASQMVILKSKEQIKFN